MVAGKLRVARFSRWSMMERAQNASDVEQAADKLVVRVQSLEGRLRSLPADVRIAFSICVTAEDTVFGLGLSRFTTKFLGVIGAEVDLSLVVHAARDGPS